MKKSSKKNPLAEAKKTSKTQEAITERKCAEEKLREASLYTRSLIEASLDPLVTISPDGKVTDVNKATEGVTGVSRAKLIGSDFSNYFTEPEKAREGYQQVFEKGFVMDYPLAIRHISGKVTDVLYNAAVYKDAAGNVTGVFAAARDITGQKRAEEARSRLASIVEYSDDAIIGKTIDGMIVSWNTGAEKTYGYSANEVLGKSVSILIPPDHFNEMPKILDRIKRGENIEHYETVRSRKDGRQIDVAITLSPIKDSEGRITGASTIAHDITERIKMEKQLHEASLYARSLIEVSLDPLVTISKEGKITDVNMATELVTGTTREKLIGSDFSNYFTEPEKAREGYRQVFEKGFVKDYPLAIRHISGSTTDVLYNAAVYKDASGKVAGVFAAARDITERKKADEEIKKLNQELKHSVNLLKVANNELEAFSYSVSHDLRAPLRHLIGFVELLNRNAPASLAEKSRHYLEVISDSATQMSKLVDDLLSFSRMGRVEMMRSRVSLDSLLTDALNTLQTETKGRDIVWKVEKLPEVNGDISMLRLVITNLISNALKFTRPRKQAEIEVGHRDTDQELIFFVRDNGVGFDMRYIDKLFNLFQRLHRTEEFEGTGVGLANVRRIIHRHGGRTWAEGAVDKGATFYFTFPKSEGGRIHARAETHPAG